MTINAIRGFRDILPEEMPWWNLLESTATRVLGRFGYREMRIPIVERTQLFARSIGEDTDIVEKEMFTFPDRHEELLTLRPEATAGVVRALIENNMTSDARAVKVFVIGPMFRYERPQKGRQRQFHQLDVEAFNDPSPHMDAELIVLLNHFLRELGLDEVMMNVNSLGCPVDRPAYKEKLIAYLSGHTDRLCADCRRRLHVNPLRVVDCKVPDCAEVVKDAPRILDSLCGDCADHFNTVQADLKAAGVPFVVNPRLVRGLDYYTRTTFEAQTGKLGAQNAVAGGGRYDGLVAGLGGGDIPASGFAVGLERLAMLLAESRPYPDADRPDLFLAALNDDAVRAVFPLVQDLRRSGIRVEADYDAGSLKSRMKRADKSRAKYVMIVGPDEIASGRVILRNMSTKEQTAAPLGEAAESVRNLIKGEGH